VRRRLWRLEVGLVVHVPAGSASMSARQPRRRREARGRAHCHMAMYFRAKVSERMQAGAQTSRGKLIAMESGSELTPQRLKMAMRSQSAMAMDLFAATRFVENFQFMG
jgi:hypothetical protein